MRLVCEGHLGYFLALLILMNDGSDSRKIFVVRKKSRRASFSSNKSKSCLMTKSVRMYRKKTSHIHDVFKLY